MALLFRLFKPKQQRDEGAVNEGHQAAGGSSSAVSLSSGSCASSSANTSSSSNLQDLQQHLPSEEEAVLGEKEGEGEGEGEGNLTHVSSFSF